MSTIEKVTGQSQIVTLLSASSECALLNVVSESALSRDTTEQVDLVQNSNIFPMDIQEHFQITGDVSLSDEPIGTLVFLDLRKPIDNHEQQICDRVMELPAEAMQTFSAAIFAVEVLERSRRLSSFDPRKLTVLGARALCAVHELELAHHFDMAPNETDSIGFDKDLFPWRRFCIAVSKEVDVEHCLLKPEARSPQTWQEYDRLLPPQQVEEL